MDTVSLYAMGLDHMSRVSPIVARIERHDKLKGTFLRIMSPVISRVQ